MIMSYLGKVEMSYLQSAIIAFLKGGCYGRKGHCHNEQERIEAVTCNSGGVTQ